MTDSRRLINRRARALATLRRRPDVQASVDVRIRIEEGERGQWTAFVVAVLGTETVLAEKASADEPNFSLPALALHLETLIEKTRDELAAALAPEVDALPPEPDPPPPPSRRGRTRARATTDAGATDATGTGQGALALAPVGA